MWRFAYRQTPPSTAGIESDVIIYPPGRFFGEVRSFSRVLHETEDIDADSDGGEDALGPHHTRFVPSSLLFAVGAAHNPAGAVLGLEISSAFAASILACLRAEMPLLADETPRVTVLDVSERPSEAPSRPPSSFAGWRTALEPLPKQGS